MQKTRHITYAFPLFTWKSYRRILTLFLAGSIFYSCKQKPDNQLFILKSPAESGIHFSNNVQDTDSLNIIQYLYYYNGGGVAIGDVDRDGWEDIYFSSNLEKNHLYLNKGNLRFEEVGEEAGVQGSGNWSTGVNMVDINADGWLDIFLCSVGNYKFFSGKNQLFINLGPDEEGTVHFEEMASAYGLDHPGLSTQTAFLDYDMDGDLDMYLLCHSVHSTDTYRDTSSSRQRNPLAGDKLYRNDLNEQVEGKPFFTEVSEEAGILGGVAGYGLGITIGDVDKNGCPDIYVGNDFHENDFLYLNQCDGTFKQVASMALGHTSNFSMGNDMADLNNDGWLDIITMDMKPEDEVLFKQAEGPDPYHIYQFKRSYGYDHQLPRNMVQVNQGPIANGDLRFSEQGQMLGLSATDWSWSVLIADFDNNGRKDIHISNGIPRRPNNLDYIKFVANAQVQERATDLEMTKKMPPGEATNYIFAQNEEGNFTNRSQTWGLSRPSISQGTAYADLDKDGDLDLVVNNMNQAAFLYENTASLSNKNHFISLSLKGSKENPQGIGAKIYMFSQDTYYYQEVSPTRGWQSSVSQDIHVGLGSIEQLDSLIIHWPDGKTEILNKLRTSQTIQLDHAQAKSTKSRKKLNSTFFQKNDDRTVLPYNHQENIFLDNKREYLLPYFLSTQGPAMAQGDVNGDDLTDLFLGGATGQPGYIFIQDQDGEFSASQSFDLDLKGEDVCAELFDANGDGYLDLYVGRAGYQFYRQDPSLQDILYLNDGKGKFKKSEASLPKFYGQSSCIKPFDFDQDGDIDIFIGNRGIPVKYGSSAASSLLINNGSGQFSLAPQSFIDLEELGMVTDGVWTDHDGDKDWDLVVIGEWMPIYIFEYQNSKFEKKKIRSKLPYDLSGFFTAIEKSDLDSDGDEDWILGNFGTNSNLQASHSEPLGLYLKDFDRNLSQDPILSYFRQGKEYTFANFDELSTQLNVLKKRFRVYDRFAESTLEQVLLPEEQKGVQYKKINTLYSFVAINDGRGRFTVKPLPQEAQIAPIHAIQVRDVNQDRIPDLILGGNLFEIQPSIGKMDASYGTLLLGKGDGSFQPIPNLESGLGIEGQVRNFGWLNLLEKPHLLVVKNNTAPELYRWMP